jgi:hypothetical protein
LADNAGEYDDWVELYNTGSSPISLANCFLTDDPTNWNRWQLPDTLLPANGFLLLWLDDDQEQGRHHANFKLGAAEELLLYRVEEGKPRIIDRASGFSPISNQTWALLPDGGSETAITTGTPGYSNVTNHIDSETESEALLYPTPANTHFFWPEQTTACILDMHGHVIVADLHYGENKCDRLSAGTYTVKSQTGTYRLLIAH